MTGSGNQTKNPDYPLFDTARPTAVAQYLGLRNILGPRETVSRLEPAGARSRNTLLRVVTNERSFVLKQFREWPLNGHAAPSAGERFQAECQFHRSARIAGCVSGALPDLLYQDVRAGCIVLEDVGPADRSTCRLAPAEAEALAWFLVGLHHHTQSVPASARYRSPELMRWQCEHLFGRGDIARAGADGSGARRARWAGGNPGVRVALECARRSLAEAGSSLVHGDFSPGNWLRAGAGRRIIDAEFSFFGRPEHDAGTFLAGLLATRQERRTIAAAVQVVAKGCFRYDARLTAAFAGAQVCAWLEEPPTEFDLIPARSAGPILRRLTAAIEAGSLERLLEPSKRLPATKKRR
jgi:5-methylthioribose kinase